MIIGLTGGIGSGKSTAAAIFKELGAFVISADEISKEIFYYPSVQSQIQNAFPDCPTRADLKRLVFANEEARKRLNSITHPLILQRVKEVIATFGSAEIVVEVPLLFESGFDSLCDVTVCIALPDKLKAERVMRRDNVSAEMAKKIIASQLSEDERAKKCQYVIKNDDLTTLKQGITDFWQELHTKK